MLKVWTDEFLWQWLSHNNISLSGVGDFLFTSTPGLLTDPTDADLSNGSLFFSQTPKNLKIPFRKINFLFIVTWTYSVQSSTCKHTCRFKLTFVNKLGFFGCLLRLNSSVPWGKKKKRERFTSIYGLIFSHAGYLLWTLRAVPLKIRSLMWCWKERAQGKRRGLIFKHKCLHDLGKKRKWIKKQGLKSLYWSWDWTPYFRLNSHLRNVCLQKSTENCLFSSISRICLLSLLLVTY